MILLNIFQSLTTEFLRIIWYSLLSTEYVASNLEVSLIDFERNKKILVLNILQFMQEICYRNTHDDFFV